MLVVLEMCILSVFGPVEKTDSAFPKASIVQSGIRGHNKNSSFSSVG